MIELNEGFHSYYVYFITNDYRSTFYKEVTQVLKIIG